MCHAAEFRAGEAACLPNGSPWHFLPVSPLAGFCDDVREVSEREPQYDGKAVQLYKWWQVSVFFFLCVCVCVCKQREGGSKNGVFSFLVFRQ